MKKLILILAIILSLSSYSQSIIRDYNKVTTWEKRESKFSPNKILPSVKLMWQNDDDNSPANLLAIFYPDRKVIIDDPPEFQGVTDGFPYYYFYGTENDSTKVFGTIILSKKTEFSVSIIYDDYTKSAIFDKYRYKPIHVQSQ